MTQIDASGGLAAVIRRQVASLSRVSGSGGTSQARRREELPSSVESNAAPERQGDIASLVARRVQAIDPDDPQRHRKAFRVFLESVLLAEFGDNLINDAGFHQLVEDVHSQMESDADLAPAIHAATTQMLAPAVSLKGREAKP